MQQQSQEPTLGQQQAADHTVLWIIWGAMTGSLGLYALVGWFVQSTLPRSAPAEFLSLLIPLFGGLSLVISFVIFSARSMLAKLTHYQYQPYSIIRWALAEAVGIHGLVLCLLGALWKIFTAFLAWAVLLQLRLMPTQDDQAQFARLARQENPQGAPCLSSSSRG